MCLPHSRYPVQAKFSQELCIVREQYLIQANALVPSSFENNPNKQIWNIRIAKARRSYLRESILDTEIGLHKDAPLAPVPLAFLTAHYASILREQYGWVSVHASAIEHENEAIVFIGSTRTGKTTLILALQRLKFGKILSSNQCCLRKGDNEVLLVAGTTQVNIRSSAKLLTKEPNIDTIFKSSFSLYSGKETLKLATKEIAVKAIYFLTPWPLPVICERILNKHELTVQLFNAFSEDSRRQVLFVSNGLISSPFDRADLTYHRISVAKEIATLVPCYNIAGPAADIANYLHNTWN